MLSAWEGRPGRHPRGLVRRSEPDRLAPGLDEPARAVGLDPELAGHRNQCPDPVRVVGPTTLAHEPRALGLRVPVAVGGGGRQRRGHARDRIERRGGRRVWPVAQWHDTEREDNDKGDDHRGISSRGRCRPGEASGVWVGRRPQSPPRSRPSVLPAWPSRQAAERRVRRLGEARSHPSLAMTSVMVSANSDCPPRSSSSRSRRRARWMRDRTVPIGISSASAISA